MDRARAAWMPALAALAAAALAWYRTGQPDYWFHLAAGRSILAHGLPRAEHWCLAAWGGRPWVGEWLFDVGLESLRARGGETAVGLWRALLAAAALALAWRIGRISGARSEVLLLCAPLALAVTRARQDPRPEQVSVVLALLFVVVFEHARRGGRDRTPWLILPQILWCQTHGGWILGPAIAAIYAIAGGGAESPPRLRMRWALLGLLLFLAGAITPRPWDILTLRAGRELSDPSLRWVDELRRWSWTTDRARPFTAWAALVAIAVAIGGRRAWRASPPLACIGIGALAAGFTAFRFEAMGTIASFPLAAIALSATDRATWRRGLAVVGAVVGVGFLVIDAPGYEPGIGSLPASVPLRAVALADSLHLEGPVLNTSWYGGYILWVRGDAHPPLVDTRNLGGPAFQGRFLRASTDSLAFDSLQARYGFTHAIAQPVGDTPDRLALQLAARPEWALIFSDDAGLLFVRRDREPAVAAAREYGLLSPDYARMAIRAANNPPVERSLLRRELERARASSPWHARASLWLGLLDLAEGRAREALQNFDEVERLAPRTPGLALRRGMARELVGDREGARADYRRALDEPPDAAAAKEALARLPGSRD